jgi:hypothetical protein
VQPRADLRDKLAEITGFIQNTPKDGEPATDGNPGVAGAHACGTVRQIFIKASYLFRF